jgi:TRAP-type mannitol/chloroaromatic compound transport system permease large subunit
VLVSVLFASMSGSAVADAAGSGLVTIRAMEKAGYPRGFAAAIVAASSCSGRSSRPSIPDGAVRADGECLVGCAVPGRRGAGLLMARR